MAPPGGAIVPTQMSVVALGGAPNVDYDTENMSSIAYLCGGFSSPVIQSTVNVNKSFFMLVGIFLKKDCDLTDSP